MNPRVAIGVGLRRGAAAVDIVALVREALARARALEPGLDCSGASLFTVEGKRGEAGLAEAAGLLGRELVFVPKEVLAAMDRWVTTRSSRVQAHFGIGSVAEAAALAGATGFPYPFGRGWREADHLLPMGEGRARPVLVVPRIASASATCAIAKSHAGP